MLTDSFMHSYGLAVELALCILEFPYIIEFKSGVFLLLYDTAKATREREVPSGEEQ